jgi:hypothetical protein
LVGPWQVAKLFLLLSLAFAVSIFLHELGHHLFGVPSVLGLAENYPLVPVSQANRSTEIIGTIAGPAVNLLLTYLGLLGFKLTSERNATHKLWWHVGVANAFLTLSAAVVNLIVDLASGSRGNDLELVSTLMGLNVFLLPAVFSLLSFFPLRTFLKEFAAVRAKYGAVSALIVAWLFSGGTLKLLDSMFHIRL